MDSSVYTDESLKYADENLHIRSSEFDAVTTGSRDTMHDQNLIIQCPVAANRK